MKTAIIIIAAYLLTGIHFVWRELRQPLWNQPAAAAEYTTRGKIRPLLFMMVYWLPQTVFSTIRRGPLRYHVASWVLFSAMVVAGLYLSSI